MKAFLIKLLVVCLAAVICDTVAGGLFSFFFYGFVNKFMPGRTIEIYISDTPLKIYLRFWIAFIVGAIMGIVWSYKVVKGIEL